MTDNKDALVPVQKPELPEEELITPVEEEYQYAKSYFKESAVQAARTNAALVTVLGLFMVRGVRLGWEAVARYFPWRRGGE